MKKVIAGIIAFAMLFGIAYADDGIIPDMANIILVGAEVLRLDNGIEYNFNEDKTEITITFSSCYTKRFSTEIEIPDTIDGLPVTKIDDYALVGFSSLTKLIIPDSVKSIGAYAFKDCENLVEVTIPDSVTDIGENAFENCKQLNEINLPSSVTNISENEFLNCGNLQKVTISGQITNIGVRAFGNCKKLTEINIPDSVTIIDNKAFSYCESLFEITIPNSVTDIGESLFENCYSLEKIKLSESIKKIPSEMFYKCYNLKEIIIPDSVTNISAYAFGNCTSLTEINIPDSVTSIGRYAFSFCSNISEVTLSRSLAFIDKNAFYECFNLKEIKIPNPETRINKEAFGYCGNYFNSGKIDDFKIYGVKSSIAQIYATKNKFEFIEIENDINTPTEMAYTSKFSVEQKTITLNEAYNEVEVQFTLDNDTHFCCSDFIFDFDEEKLSLEEIKIGNSIIESANRGFIYLETSSTEKRRFVFVSVDNDDCMGVYKGEVVKLLFKLNNPQVDDIYEITAKNADSVLQRIDGELVEMSVKFSPGYIKIVDECTTIGDIDADRTIVDNKITSSDALNVLQLVVSGENLTDEQKKLADMDGDGEITSADALYILQMVVGLR